MKVLRTFKIFRSFVLRGRRRPASLFDIRSKHVTGDQKAILYQFFDLLEVAILVLDADHVAKFDSILGCELDDRRPYAGVFLQVSWNGLVLVLADEGTRHGNVQQAGCDDRPLICLSSQEQGRPGLRI